MRASPTKFKLWFGFISLSIASILYNNWILGRWLNPLLFKANGSVSEFSVHGQPHYLIFKLLDIVSGLLLVIASILVFRQLGASRLGLFILILTVILGLANIADAVDTLPCSETLSAQCHIPVSVSFNHYQVPTHGYSSTVIALCYFFLPLGGLIWGFQRRIWLVIAASSVALADAILSLILAVSNYITNQSLSVRTSGAGQEVEMIILAVWLIIFYFCCLRYLAKKPTAGSAKI